MASKPSVDDMSTISSLPEAISFIKFLKVSHKAELAKWMDACNKQAKIIKKLESNRHQELVYLSNQLHKYEFDLLARENDIAKQIAEKDHTIDILTKTIDSLQEELKLTSHDSSKTRSDSCDSGIITDKIEDSETTIDLKQNKSHRPSIKSINIFRKVDFSPKKNNKTEVASSKKKSYNFRKAAKMWKSIEKSSSEDEMSSLEDVRGFLVQSPRKLDESMTNHFCDEPSESEREKIFDRVMARASVRRSVKNPKYQKINRQKSKYLEGLTNTCEYTDSST